MQSTRTRDQIKALIHAKPLLRIARSLLDDARWDIMFLRIIDSELQSMEEVVSQALDIEQEQNANPFSEEVPF